MSVLSLANSSSAGLLVMHFSHGLHVKCYNIFLFSNNADKLLFLYIRCSFIYCRSKSIESVALSHTIAAVRLTSH